ncbi:uncharacterized protein [Epargyreus clarus]|uniref:uncharacterized protein n=1 Tax=Epargyreus clarus TaxID=520877 RepID=UPI003C304411
MPESKLKELISKRSYIKGRLTKFRNYLTTLEKLSGPSDIEVSTLGIQLSRIEGLSCSFDELQGEIEILNCANIDDELTERDNIELDFAFLIATAQSLQSKHNTSNTSKITDVNSSASACCPSQPGIGFKPPTLQIAKFDGSYFRWLEFRDLYCSLVHDNQYIPTPVKFCYLNSYLEGEAARVISNLEVTESNYHKAWELLRERYDNKRLLIKSHLNSLLNFNIKHSETDKGLRSIIDNINKNLRALSSLGEPTSHWDTLIIHIVASKLSSKTSLKWEEYRNTLSDSPTLAEFTKFLKNRADILETYNHNRTSDSIPNVKVNKVCNNNPRINQSNMFAAQIVNIVCAVCKGQHKIYECSDFKSKSIQQRQGIVAKLKLCHNCLHSGHTAYTCRFGVCRNCKRRHNTLLCNNNKASASQADASSSSHTTVSSETQTNMSVHFSANNINKFTLLSTAVVEAVNPQTNKRAIVRILLDSGSQSSLMSQSLKDMLGLQSLSMEPVNIVGIGNSIFHCVNDFCSFQLKSLNSDYITNLTCPVLPKLTDNIPKSFVNAKFLNIPANVQLADPTFYNPSPIDVLVGADLFFNIVGSERQSLGSNKPQLIYTEFGWIISGSVCLPYHISNRKSNYINCNFNVLTNQDNFNNRLSKFWELEEIPNSARLLSEDEKACEQHFKNNTTRDSFGRFCVRLPLKYSPHSLGNSYLMAKNKFLNLEKRFKTQPELKVQYSQFIDEYRKLGHCSVLIDHRPQPSYFLCHHAVFKQSSESTKLRVVFDGSACTSSGLSINSLQYIGPTVQDSLFSILLRFRQHQYVLTGDIEKMFRQINVHEDDRNLQLILWREDESRPLQVLRLNTVTYGLASASYLSTKCIWQLGEECRDDLIKQIIQRDFYMDDLITGTDSISQLHHILILRSGCFPLRKFKSNVASILEDTLKDNQGALTLSESTSTLGIMAS